MRARTHADCLPRGRRLPTALTAGSAGSCARRGWAGREFSISWRLPTTTCSRGGRRSRRAMCHGSSGARSRGTRLVARDTSFYYSFLVLPPDKRRAIVAVWDFCRAVDDAFDEAETGAAPEPGATAPGGRPTDALAELGAWREELARCFDGVEPRTPQ